MRWKGREKSDNIEDRRGSRVPGGAKGLGLGAILIVVVAALFGADPSKIMSMLGGGQGALAGGATAGGPVDEAMDGDRDEFAKVVLRDTEEVWHAVFQSAFRRQYQEPTMVFFKDMVESACGNQSSAVGPFYCGADQKVYIDLEFFTQLDKQLGAPGDFAQAYVIAHEVGHHIQNLLGTSPQVHKLQRGMSKTEANELSVRLELQADYYAGVWAHHADKRFNSIESGDIEEALNAANKIGDDMLQRRSGGPIQPDLFTHGTAAQRERWFRRGFQYGDPNRYDTFDGDYEDL